MVEGGEGGCRQSTKGEAISATAKPAPAERRKRGRDNTGGKENEEIDFPDGEPSR